MMETGDNRESSTANALAADKVAVIRKALADGSYVVNNVRVAEKLIDYMLEFASTQSRLGKNSGASAAFTEMRKAG